MKIIEAAPADLETIRDIAARTWPLAYGSILKPEQIAYMLDLFYSEEALLRQMSIGHRFLLLINDGVPVGFAGYELDFGPSAAKLQKLYVLPERQGMGAGYYLLEAVADAARAGGQQRLFLNVNRNNNAIAFYERQGFVIVGEEDIDIGEDYFMNDYIMEKIL